MAKLVQLFLSVILFLEGHQLECVDTSFRIEGDEGHSNQVLVVECRNYVSKSLPEPHRAWQQSQIYQVLEEHRMSAR